MAPVLVLAAVLWGVGAVLGTPRRTRWTMIGLLYLAVLFAHAVLPEGHPLRTTLGGSLAEWLVLGGLVALVWVYRRGLAVLKSRVARDAGAPETEAAGPARFREGELPRYARHIALREIGGSGQTALKQARVLVVGAGGLGSPALLHLAAAGVGTIGVIDDDVVEATNLQRQVAHADDRIGMPKVFSAERAMRALNPFAVLRPYHRRLTPEIAAGLFAEYDLILEGTDDIETRYLVNRVAAGLGVPVIGAAISQWEGQVSLWHPASGGPCYQCVFPEPPAPGLAPTCAEAGVAGPLPGVVGSIMALEAVKQITGAGQGLRGRLMIYDGLYAETRVITVHSRADCPVCGGQGAG
ncbi:HesA/MoeB/ThiF family protein [Mesobaculum littorinae]|uniref:Molybdopterin-synthase adenylyltransferase n=1 Tax=Mesobaculum littorinae TaxID=2486419 RepID=A0A438ADF2_9RHOB|nr:HesA/MoeB/ThiF family protein [Mesobaculum littorinae]RVV96730.1 HesA/MoeB/ThiF family protein [Mesobaculum littorinae]